jgi:hypothetical protein
LRRFSRPEFLAGQPERRRMIIVAVMMDDGNDGWGVVGNPPNWGDEKSATKKHTCKFVL